MPTEVSRSQVLAFRWHAHQLGRTSATAPDDCALLDLGIQDTGGDGASWALRVRGTPPDRDGSLALAWTLRGAPHCYRRVDLPAIAVATQPLSEADAGKRIFDANKPLKAAGIPALTALREVATQMREIVTEPTVKGAMSSALTDRLPDPYQRFCRPCNTIHLYEMPFRLAALQAGLELRPGTSPPMLERIPSLRPGYFGGSGADAEPRFDVVRGFLRFFGPATPKHVAGYIDAPVKDVKAQWPADAVEVSVAGETRWILGDDLPALLDPPAPHGVRLLGPYDPYLQLRDRELLVPHTDQHKALWPVLGRPGVIVDGGEVVGLWRPRTSGRKLTVQITPWTPLTKPLRAAIDEQARRLAEHREVTLAAVTE
ncbi:winged helix DNA-binding domain-containing protein [Rhodococcus sp. D2-41]|uniref:winged helix DNA-binding domain-containing protein n=1 Tax=Speluncibacter jeojiensis TaxID=2710754 RepID=UPI00240F7DBB|nr:winged helix DNA-binding domain-containing protein [Rhodococcus sp. D2-41]MDG3012423.1 winged helix DNA-binding domain-containing protein [Rhodococcus sp. D2-41]